MTRAETLRALADRCEEASGPDRELDGEIMFSLFAKPVGENGYLWPEDDPSWSFAIRFPGKDRAWFRRARAPISGETILVWRDGAPILMNSLRVPKLTASLDAAVALTERLLPGRMAILLFDALRRSPPTVTGPEIARRLVAATLRALAEKERTDA